MPAPTPTAHDAKEALLKRVSLFESLTGDEVTWLAARLSRHEYQANQQILTSEAVPDSLSIVHSGVLAVTFAESSGSREIARIGPDETFGETGLLAGLPMHVSIATLTPCVLYQVSKDDMTSFLKEHPQVAKQMCRLLAYRQDAIGKLMTAIPAAKDTDHSVFQWLFDKVRQLHSLRDDS
jgi:CRP-like cAMP-binding protein